MIKTRRFSLIDLPTLYVDADIAASMARIVEASGFSREQAVDRLNAAALRHGVRICSGSAKALSLATFEKWLNPKETEHTPPTRTLNLFCHVFESMEPLDILAKSHGWGSRMVDSEEAKVLEVALLERTIKELRAQKRKKEAEL